MNTEQVRFPWGVSTHEKQNVKKSESKNTKFKENNIKRESKNGKRIRSSEVVLAMNRSGSLGVAPLMNKEIAKYISVTKVANE